MFVWCYRKNCGLDAAIWMRRAKETVSVLPSTSSHYSRFAQREDGIAFYEMRWKFIVGQGSILKASHLFLPCKKRIGCPVDADSSSQMRRPASLWCVFAHTSRRIQCVCCSVLYCVVLMLKISFFRCLSYISQSSQTANRSEHIRFQLYKCRILTHRLLPSRLLEARNTTLSRT